MEQIKQCDIWVLDFDPSIGQEIQKTRPALVISNDFYNIGSGTIFVVPLTTSVPKYKNSPFHVSLSEYNTDGLQSDSFLSVSQFRAVSKKRFKKKIGSVDQSILPDIGKKFFGIMRIDTSDILDS